MSPVCYKKEGLVENSIDSIQVSFLTLIHKYPHIRNAYLTLRLMVSLIKLVIQKAIEEKHLNLDHRYSASRTKNSKSGAQISLLNYMCVLDSNYEDLEIVLSRLLYGIRAMIA